MANEKIIKIQPKNIDQIELIINAAFYFGYKSAYMSIQNVSTYNKHSYGWQRRILSTIDLDIDTKIQKACEDNKLVQICQSDGMVDDIIVLSTEIVGSEKAKEVANYGK